MSDEAKLKERLGQLEKRKDDLQRQHQKVMADLAHQILIVKGQLYDLVRKQ